MRQEGSTLRTVRRLVLLRGRANNPGSIAEVAPTSLDAAFIPS